MSKKAWIAVGVAVAVVVLIWIGCGVSGGCGPVPSFDSFKTP